MAHDMYPPDPPLLTPELLLRGYVEGIFPMAEGRQDREIYWVDPKIRGILPLDGFHISKSLRKLIRKAPWRVSLDEDFPGVVQACADREETWINSQIFDAYLALHRGGFAHSVELWDGRDLVGGVYGVTVGAAFFGESMFSRRPNASKVALAYLVYMLREGGFTLFDTQFVTDHLASLGAIGIPRSDYRRRLRDAVSVEATPDPLLLQVSPPQICT